MNRSPAFEQRLALSEYFEKCCLAFFKEAKIDCTINGSEHTHRELIEKFRNDDSPRAKMIRFTPDTMVYMDGNLCYFEAKAGKNIEKDAYVTYHRIHKTVMPVILMMWCPNGKVKWQFVDQIQFVDSRSVVAKYVNKAHPIDADGWINPRLGHGNAGRGSGTAYKEVLFSSMKSVIGFWESVCRQSPELLNRPSTQRFGGGL